MTDEPTIPGDEMDPVTLADPHATLNGEIAPGGEPSAQRALDRSLMGGLAWTGGAKWALQILSWGSTLVVARLLSPADFGLYGMGVLYLGLVELVNELGLSASIVQRKELDPVLASDLGGLSVVFGAFLSLASLAMAGPISVFFGNPAVRPLIQVLSVTFIASALQVLPSSLMTRNFRFSRLALIEVCQGLVLTGTTLVLALAGMRYWALVYGAVAGRLVAAIVANSINWHPYRLRFNFERVKDALAFGSHVVVGRMAFYAYSNADFTVVGKMLGAAPLGAYSLGWQLANIPVDRIAALVGRVSPAFFARLQHEDAELRRYLRALTEGLSLVTFPASALLALEADDLVHVGLGDKWDAAVLPLRLLAIYASLRSVTTLFPHMLVAKGLSKRSMQFNIVAAIVMPIMFVLASRWGLVGVASAWIVGYPMVAGPLFLRTTLRLIGMRWSEWLGALVPAATATLAMIALLVLFRTELTGGWTPLYRLGMQSVVGLLTYAGAIWLVHKKRIRSVIQSVRQARA